MNLIFERRARISERSLHRKERERLKKVFDELSRLNKSSVPGNPKISRLKVGLPGKEMYVYGADNNLRLIFSFGGEGCVIEDILDKERLDLFLKQKRKS